MASYLWLLPTVRHAIEGDSLLFFDHAKQVSVSHVGEAGASFVQLLDGTKTKHELSANPLSEILIPILLQNGWLVTLAESLAKVVGEREWLSRQLSYFAHITRNQPDNILAELAKCSILIIGVGGVGSQVAFSLAASGVGRLIVVDPDVVEKSNLNRQFLYDSDDVGRRKVQVVTEKLGLRFPGVAITPILTNFDVCQESTSLPDCDLTIVCGELRSIYTRPQIIGQRPILVGGYWGSIGVVGPLLAPKLGTPCWQCLLEAKNPTTESTNNCSWQSMTNSWNASGSTINGVVGQLLSEVAIRFLSLTLREMLPKGERLLVDMSTLTISRDRTLECECIHRL